MANLPENTEIDKDFGRRSGKEPERSNFSQTCSLLSHYLKKNGSFGELSDGVARKLEAAKGKSEIFNPQVARKESIPISETSAGLHRGQNIDASSPFRRPADSVQKFSGFVSSDLVQEAIGKSDFGKPATSDPETAQLTLFYAGLVLVFDDFPAEKVKEVISVARKASSRTSSVSDNARPGSDKVNPGKSDDFPAEKVKEVISVARKVSPQTSSVANNPNPGPDKVNTGKSVSFSPDIVSLPTISPAQSHVQLQPLPEANGSDLRIVRRSSLRKFFEKRKDRATSKAPYQINNNPASPLSSSQLDELEEAQTSNNLDLNL